jgi:hypothetical protein
VAQKERYEEFDASLKRIYEDEDEEFFVRSQVEIREQIQLEGAQRSNITVGHALIEIFNRKNIRRTAMAIMVMQVGILSGSLAIQNYQSILYGSLGFKGRQVILISGCYGFMGIVGQIINFYGVSDRWPRVRTMCTFLNSLLYTRSPLISYRAWMPHPCRHALDSHGSLPLLR